MSKQTKSNNVVSCSRRQKILGVIALGGLFLCGVMIGMTLSSQYISRVGQPDMSSGATDVPETKDTVVATPAEYIEIGARPTCELVEELLTSRLNPENDMDPMAHRFNYRVYQKLASRGCPQNQAHYEQMMGREIEIIGALNENEPEYKEEPICVKIETEVGQQIRDCGEWGTYECHIDNAKVYANLSERGCQQDSEHYVELARQELALARAVSDDKMNQDDTIEVVETYKRLHMQAAAEDILAKAKKLTNPAIEFILQLEKIINEQ